MKYITESESIEVAHLLKEAQRRYAQTSELIDEIISKLDITGELEQSAADAVFQSMTINQLLSILNIELSLPHVEDHKKYDAKQGWIPKNA